MSAAIDISFLRALKTPCTCPTLELSVSRTVRFGESEVCRIMVSPFRALMRPSTFTDWAVTIWLNNARPTRDRLTRYAILRTSNWDITCLLLDLIFEQRAQFHCSNRGSI